MLFASYLSTNITYDEQQHIRQRRPIINMVAYHFLFFFLFFFFRRKTDKNHLTIGMTSRSEKKEWPFSLLVSFLLFFRPETKTCFFLNICESVSSQIFLFFFLFFFFYTRRINVSFLFFFLSFHYNDYML